MTTAEKISQGVPDFVTTEPVILVQVIELFRNERYSPLSGFGAKGLLVNDRGAISNENGTSSWKSLEEAVSSLVSYGKCFPFVISTFSKVIYH